MKNALFTLGILILGTTLAMAQHSPKNDPSYSVNNYKHPNKAAYAKKHQMDKSSASVTNVERQNDNYKQTFRKEEPSEKAVIKTRKSKDKKNRSYKHPYGL